MMPTIRVATINVRAIRKSVKKIRVTPAISVLKKQLSNYEKWKSDPDYAFAVENLKHGVMNSVHLIRLAASQTGEKAV